MVFGRLNSHAALPLLLCSTDPPLPQDRYDQDVSALILLSHTPNRSPGLAVLVLV